MARRTRIPRRKRFFVGCEGESEQGYAALLQQFADQAGLSVHIDANVMPRAGDPLKLVERAMAAIEKKESGAKPPYLARFLLLDTDLIGQNADRDRKMLQLAQRTDLILIKQNCCFEAFLLRHFAGHENDAPPDAATALGSLRGVWENYQKGTPAQELAKKLTLEHVRSAATRRLNSDLSQLLDTLGLNA